MTFTFACRACGQENQAEWSQAGQKIACDGCRKPLTVPAPREASDAPNSNRALPLQPNFARC